MTNALFSFMHHVAAFALVTTLAIELVLLRDPPTLSSARKLMVADMIYGICAGTVLVVGFIRVCYFEKGATYYFHSIPFIAKLSLFALIGLVSIYPTLEFLSWRKLLKQDRIPTPDTSKVRLIRTFIRLELTGVVLILLCAALMAKGIGTFG